MDYLTFSFEYPNVLYIQLPFILSAIHYESPDVGIPGFTKRKIFSLY